MHPKTLIYCTCTFIFFSEFFVTGQTSSNLTEILASTTTTTTKSATTVALCPERDQQGSSGIDCSSKSGYQKNENITVAIASQERASSGRVRRYSFLFLGCLLTVFVMIALIFTYNRVVGQNHRHQSTDSTTIPTIRTRIHSVLQSLGLSDLRKHGRFNFFSITNNNYSSGHIRQGETSHTHLTENQDEALLFDDPYADGGIASGIHGSSSNPYKSLTLSVT